MLRVLQVVTYMGRGGLETMLMNYYRHIDRTKVQFDFLTHRDFEADYDREIERLGGIIYHLPVLNPFGKKYRKALSDFFDKHKEYQVIHVHQDCMSSVILKEAAKHGVKVRVAHSHNSSQDKNAKYLIKLFYRYFIPQYATFLMACGDEAGHWMFRGAKFQVINNAIDAEKYAFDAEKKARMRKQLGIEDCKLVVGHVGRFSYSKNHMFLLDIFKAVLEKKDAILILVGDGNLRTEIEKKANFLGLQNKIIFTGIRSDVDHLLQAMDVFVFPSNYEGIPVTLIEAQASGLPCLISDKVPIECKKTDLVQQISLDQSAEVWANRIVSIAQDTKRRNMYEEIKGSGYDIKENAKWLQDFYLNAVGEGN